MRCVGGSTSSSSIPPNRPSRGLLGRWLDKHDLTKFQWLERVLEKANEKLAEDKELRGDHAALGPSYFMPRDKKLDKARIERIWEHNVMPYIEERLFGQSDRLKQFELDSLRKEDQGSTEEGNASGVGRPRG